MLIKLLAMTAFLLIMQVQAFLQAKTKARKETFIHAKAGSGDKQFDMSSSDSLAKKPKTRGNYVTLCFRNNTNQFIDVWNGNYYWGRLSPAGWSASPNCFYINNNYYYRDWSAKTTDGKYYWTFTRTTYNDDIVVVSW